MGRGSVGQVAEDEAVGNAAIFVDDDQFGVAVGFALLDDLFERETFPVCLGRMRGEEDF